MSISAIKSPASPASLGHSRPKRRAPNPFDWSRSVAERIERAVLGNYSIETVYRDTIRNSLKDGALVLDAGAGERCVYANRSLRVIGSDTLLGDLRNNRDIQCAVLADLEGDFPFRPNSLDAVTACYLAEHIHDCKQFVRNVASVLRPGGKIFLLFPCRYAPFAVINRLVSNKLTKKMLQHFCENSHGGFPTTYNNCLLSRMCEILEKHDLRILGTEVCFYQSHYYASFLPIYLCSLAYDIFMKALNIRRMAASAFVFAEKTGQCSNPR
jgi:SAM-dependent methyltransferase